MARAAHVPHDRAYGRGRVPISSKWQACLAITAPEKSLIAHKMNITKPGKYALKVR